MSYSRVKIAARLRPAIPGEIHDNAIRVLHSDAGPYIDVDNPRDPSQTFKYPFSSCYDQSSSQDQIFDRDVKPLIEVVFSGVTATVFAYGVTSSGKTHTMQGNTQHPGIIPRAVEEIFRRAASTGLHASIAASYMEIYKDEVYDLLVDRETAAKLPVRENEVGQVFVANLSMLPLDSLQDFHKIFLRANKQRSVSSTNLNSVSSRSHAILTIHVNVIDPVANMTLAGKLNLVDLAGSENNKLTGNDATRMAESAAINKSLSVLGQVVHALNQGASRIPYRNSKLTRILQDALGGSSIGLLICNLAPGTRFRQDTLNTLNFAVRTKNIQNKPVVNQQATTAAALPKPIQLSTSFTLTSFNQPSSAATAGPSRLPGPRPSRVPRPSGFGLDHVGGRSSLPLPPVAEAIKIEEKPPVVPAHLTEEEINARIAKAVEREVARRLEEERERLRREEEERAANLSAGSSASASRNHHVITDGSTNISINTTQEDNSTSSSSSALESLPSGMLTPLLKSKAGASEDELKRRLDELEARFERANKAASTALHLADVLSPISKKKTGRAYVALARSQSQKNNLEVALELYRKAETYVPDNVKLRESRIIEIEWAVKNNRPFNPSPKKRRRAAQSKSKSGRSKRKATPSRDQDGDAEESGKENFSGDEALSAGKRKVEDAEAGTPPRKRRLVKIEELA
ncbi:kinesin-domain-containing protein [Dichomitus squalens]|uniref:Kinesin-like protein n=1 Tax=Dichomitus squalens TaxID=114155 RepID=A0A4Q9PGU5_9APHY|nr:kinesin-domain-containing protein [Dichomitus squalens]